MTMELDETLTTLRKHNVTEFSQDQFGIRVKFAEQIPREDVASLVEQWTKDVAKDRMKFAEPIVDAQQFDINDVLYGAK